MSVALAFVSATDTPVDGATGPSDVVGVARGVPPIVGATGAPMSVTVVVLSIADAPEVLVSRSAKVVIPAVLGRAGRRREHSVMQVGRDRRRIRVGQGVDIASEGQDAGYAAGRQRSGRVSPGVRQHDGLKLFAC